MGRTLKLVIPIISPEIKVSRATSYQESGDNETPKKYTLASDQIDLYTMCDNGASWQLHLDPYSSGDGVHHSFKSR